MPDLPLDPEPPPTRWDDIQERAGDWAHKAQQPTRLPVWWAVGGWLLSVFLTVLIVLR